MINVALIPPRGLQAYALHSTFHMVLAARACRMNDEYMDLYTSVNHGFIMLDNGANEDGRPVGGDMLCNIAELVGANEIVLPDVMGNRERTIDAVDKFLATYTWESRAYRRMAVIHAETQRQAMNTIRYWAQNPLINTIGIPRIYADEEVARRLRLAEEIRKIHSDRFDIHFLGSVVAWPGEVKAAAKYAPFVRSIDTSMPFNFTIARKKLADSPRLAIPRVPNYFVRDYGGLDKELLKANIDTFKEWASGQAPAS